MHHYKSRIRQDKNNPVCFMVKWMRGRNLLTGDCSYERNMEQLHNWLQIITVVIIYVIYKA